MLDLDLNSRSAIAVSSSISQAVNLSMIGFLVSIPFGERDLAWGSFSFIMAYCV